jgi:sarcosine oxidase subunit alpha
VARLLNFLYVNKWSKLDVGSVRYGVMCGEDGVVLDDGVTGRLGPDHYFMSTTSSGAAAVLDWIESWLQMPFRSWKVHVTSVVSAFASINIAGPSSRELLGRIVDDIDLSPEAFRYMQVRTGRIAGVPGSHVWRIGFTGELSYEIHVPAGYGLFVWERLMEEGADLGVEPFGLEAQRILRLEKGHFIVGQDTDGVTQALSAGLDWLVKLDKEDFAGKPELAWQAARDGEARLVGLQPDDPELVPPEASQIVSGMTTIEGRVTSSRYSPTLGRSICLALVSARLATPGTKVLVLLPDGRRVGATVMEHHAHFDPDGSRLRG